MFGRWPPLLVSGDVREKLIQRCERVLVVLCQIPTHAGVGKKSLHVFACGGQIEHVVTVSCLDAVDVLEQLVGFPVPLWTVLLA